MAGVVDLLERCYSGLSMHQGTLVLDPVLPPQLGQLDLTLHYRGHGDVLVRLAHQHASVTLPPGTAPPIHVVVHGATTTLRAGGTLRVDPPADGSGPGGGPVVSPPGRRPPGNGRAGRPPG
jgi:trehalose/maltose hydrolase-like predicted phosphorylase